MQKRLAVIGFSALAALIAAVFLGGMGAFIAGGCTALFLAGFSFVKKVDVIKKYGFLSAALLTASLAFFVYGTVCAVRFAPAMVYADTAADIKGQILDYPQAQYQKHYYTVQVESVRLSGGDWKAQNFKIRMSSAKPLVCKPGDHVETTVQFFQYQSGFGLSAQSRYFSKGIALGGYISGYGAVIVESQKSPAGFLFQTLHRNLVRQTKVLYPREEASVISAMLLGYADDLTPETQLFFRESGTTHLLVVSGMHMALISALVLWALGLLPLPKIWKNSIAILALCLFMLLTGMQTSVVRSGITAVLWLLADMLGRETDAMNALGFAVLVMCAANPLIGGDAGFLMSVLATAGILTVLPKTAAWFSEKRKRYPKIAWVHPLYAAVCLSISASLFVLPIQVFLFHSMPVAAPFATVILTLPSSVLIYTSALSLLFSSVWFLAPFAVPLVFLAGACAKICRIVAKLFAQLSITQINISGDLGMLALGAGLFIVALTVCISAKGRRKLLAAGLCILLFCSSVGLRHLNTREITSLAIANASEDSTVVLMKNGEGAVLALSGYNTALPLEILQAGGVKKLKALFLLEDDAKTQEAAMQILNKYLPEKVYLGESVWLNNALLQKLGGTQIALVGEAEETAPLFSGISGKFSATGSLRLEVSGQNIMLERGEAEKRSADILVTADLSTQADSPFTVLQTDDIILEELKKAGRYVCTSQRRITYIDIKEDGTFELRGEK